MALAATVHGAADGVAARGAAAAEAVAKHPPPRELVGITLGAGAEAVEVSEEAVGIANNDTTIPATHEPEEILKTAT